MSATTKGVVFAALLLAVVLDMSVAGREILNTPNEPCDKPPEGDWTIEHNLPVPGTNRIALQGRSVMTLREQFDNVYVGHGAGVAVVDGPPIFSLGTPFTYELLAIFDPELCILAGTLYDIERTPFADPIIWHYDGQSLSGPFVSLIMGEVAFNRTGRHDLTYIG